ncbi:hypothetical protein N9Y42_07745 [Mariniblastus sp.]|nr:hypothetical protein [Mariniblastus sp.]
MSTKKNDLEKSKLLKDMHQYAFEKLERELWLNIKELHEELSDTFADGLAKVKGTLEGKKRSQADNLIDWVKSDITRDARCLKHDGHYFFLPSSGIMHNEDQVDLNHARKLALKVFQDMQTEKKND